MKVTYKKSLTAKLVLERDAISNYQVLKDVCATHKNVRCRMSFSKESVSYQRKKVAVFKISRKNLSVYLALNPANYDPNRIHFKDVSSKKAYAEVPFKLDVKGSRSLKVACAYLEEALASAGATTLCTAKDIDYREVFYERSFDELLSEGYIKKYVRKVVDGKEVTVEELPETFQVHFTAKLCYEATDQADELYIISSFDHWNPQKALPMKKVSNSSFEATASYPKNTHLEFKICRKPKWTDVEKGIWKEEIVNHEYVVVDHDLNVEDLIYNFRSKENEPAK